MPSSFVHRYWFIMGNYDAYLGMPENPPVTVGKADRYYAAGHHAAKYGRIYRKHFPTGSPFDVWEALRSV